MPNVVFVAAFYICLIAIEFLATTTIQIEVVESSWDKANHFIAFFVLYVLLSLSYEKMSVRVKTAWLILFGFQIEIVQSFIEGRYFSLMDVVADSVGILIGVVLYKFYISFTQKAS